MGEHSVPDCPVDVVNAIAQLQDLGYPRLGLERVRSNGEPAEDR